MYASEVSDGRETAPLDSSPARGDRHRLVAVVGDDRMLCESVARVLATAAIPVMVVDPAATSLDAIGADAVVWVVRRAEAFEAMMARVQWQSPGLAAVLLAPTRPSDPALTHRWAARLDFYTPVDTLIHTIERVLRGLQISEIASPSPPKYDPDGRGEMEFLTPREREILLLLGTGDPVVRIAARLDIADSTVRTHIAHIRSKLGVHTRLDAVRVAHGQTRRVRQEWDL